MGLRYNCDAYISKGLGLRYDNETVALEEKRYHALERKARSSGTHMECAKGMMHFHRPLRRDTSTGHRSRAGKDEPVEAVASFFRDPVARAASGFVNSYHDCPQARYVSGMSHYRACRVLTMPNASAEALRQVQRTIRFYAHCLAGCQAAMVTGHSCVRANASEDDWRVAEAALKIPRFAFVGITEHWVASECVFARDFPRPLGRTYPRTKHLRPSTSARCEREVVAHLRNSGFVDRIDTAVYNAALAEFDRRLGNCSA
jgi:hypothetical protein